MTKVDPVTLVRPQNAASDSSRHAGMVWIPGAVTSAGMAIGKTAIAGEGRDRLVSRPAGVDTAAGVYVILRSA